MNYFVMLFIGCVLGCNSNKDQLKNTTIFEDTVKKNEKNILLDTNYTVNIDSIKNKILETDKSVLDTLKYQFILEDVGTEGTHGVAYYTNYFLKNININIFTSMNKIHIIYDFNYGTINVREEIFSYKYNAHSLKSHDDFELIKTSSYQINEDGLLLNGVDSDRIDIFTEIKRNIPFSLK